MLILRGLFHDDAATLATVEKPGLARLGIGLERGVGLAEARARGALGFRVVSPGDAFGAGAIAAFGLVNAVAIRGERGVSGHCTRRSRQLVGDPGDAQLMYPCE